MITGDVMTDKTWTEEELDRVNSGLDGRPPEEVLGWVVDNFDTGEFALACSLGELVLLDMLVGIKKDARIFFIDTDLHFKETLELRELVEKRYGITLERYAPELTVEEMAEKYGPELWKRDPDKCCRIRKVEPLKRVLSTLKLWITGIRRDQSETRRNAPVVGWDARNGLIKVNPLACWTRKEVWDYILKHKVPYNALLDKGYPSIGCGPCTCPVGEGEDQRSGRWAGRFKTECGLHE